MENLSGLGSFKMVRITFILPQMFLVGGNRVIGKYAQELVLLGHQVSIVSRKPKRSKLRDLLRGRVEKNRSSEVVKDYFSGVEETVSFVSADRSLRPSDLPDADFLIATWWETVEWASGMPASKGRIVHFMQGYEMFPWLPLERVAATYEEDTLKISISNWVTQQVLEHHGRSTEAIIHNAVDTDLFSFRLGRNNKKTTLGFVYGPMGIKNSQLAFALQDVLADRGCSCDLLAFHSDPLPVELKDRTGLKSYQRPPQAQIPSLYQQCDLWLFPSLEEGFGLPIIEALSCGTPVLATRAGAAPELIRTGENGYLCDSTAESFADAVESFTGLEAADKLMFAKRARETVTNWTWANCAQRLMEVLEPHLRE
jgi:glycosyltransferase involved in cell wall biosynthesis